MTAEAKELHLKPVSGSAGRGRGVSADADASVPRVKPAPDTNRIPVPFVYTPSEDGTDENLLILLHGLGDTHVPFGKLGKQLRLPQTATLALRAPQQIPYLLEEAYQWYPSFDELGEPIVHPDPTAGVAVLTQTIAHLTRDCAWGPRQIHLFGFAQGGSVALETALTHWKTRPRYDVSAAAEEAHALGSVVSVGGAVLVHHAIGTACKTAVLVVRRAGTDGLVLERGERTVLARLFGGVREEELGAGESMPCSEGEWRPIMEFWSERLGRRLAMEEGLYEVG